MQNETWRDQVLECGCGCGQVFNPDRRTQKYVRGHRHSAYKNDPSKSHACPLCGGKHRVKAGAGHA